MKTESNNNNNTLDKILNLWLKYTTNTQENRNRNSYAEIECVSCAVKHDNHNEWLKCLDGDIDLKCPGCPWE